MLGRRTNVIGPRRLLFRYCTEGNFALQPSRRRASRPTLLARGSNKNRIIAIIIMIIIMIIIIILSIVIVATTMSSSRRVRMLPSWRDVFQEGPPSLAAL